jgi:Winged helix-turn-helix DNA-binding
MPYAELADQVGVSRGATRARVLRLLRAGVVVVAGMRNATAFGVTPLCGFQARLGGSGQGVVACARMHGVDFLARTLGRCDVVGTINALCRGEAHVALERIRAMAGTRAVQTWWQLELIKQRYVAESLRGLLSA